MLPGDGFTVFLYIDIGGFAPRLKIRCTAYAPWLSAGAPSCREIKKIYMRGE